VQIIAGAFNGRHPPDKPALPMQRGEHRAYLRGRTRQQQDVGDAFLDCPSVALVHFELGCARHDSVASENLAKFAEKFAVD
jgi:hypothetical protein